MSLQGSKLLMWDLTWSPNGCIGSSTESAACVQHVCSSLESEYGSTAYGCQSCSWPAERGNIFFTCPRSRRRIWTTGYGCQPCSWSAEQRKMFLCCFSVPCPRSRLRIWSRETGSAVPSRPASARSSPIWRLLTSTVNRRLISP